MTGEVAKVLRREAGAMPPDRPAVGAVEARIGAADEDGDTPVSAEVAVVNPTSETYEEVIVELVALDAEGRPLDRAEGRGGPLPAVGVATVAVEGYLVGVSPDGIADIEVWAKVVETERIGVRAELAWED